MERKIVLGLATFLMTLLASFAFVPLASTQAQTHRYFMMGGEVKMHTQLGAFPPSLGYIQIKPKHLSQNITFSAPWELTPGEYIVNLTVPAETYVGLNRTFYDGVSLTWYRLSLSMATDGYGWVFLNATGDVDCYTFNNDTGVYFFGPDRLAGTVDDSFAGPPPQTGQDGIPGTADDDFGDDIPDPAGSSILYLPTTLHWEYWDGIAWRLLFDAPLPQVFTTGTAYDIVTEPNSLINGFNSTEVGEPWEFFAGLDHPEYLSTPWKHPKCNAYVIYVCAWSILDISTTLGDCDLCFTIIEKKVRDDCAIPDINCDEKVTITDIVTCALAFGSKEGEPHYIPIVDFNCDGKINIIDIVIIAIHFGAYITPDCIIRP